MVKYLLLYLSVKIRQMRMCGTRFPLLLQLGRNLWSTFVVVLNAKILVFLLSFDNVNTVDNLYLACSGPFIFLLCITLVFCAEMVFSANCVCSNHSTWHHREVSTDSLLIATAGELLFCNVDRTTNKNRRRRICLTCRGRIALEFKLQNCEVSFCDSPLQKSFWPMSDLPKCIVLLLILMF